MNIKYHVENIQESMVDNVKVYHYQNSPMFDTKAKLIIWIRNNILELEHASA